MKRTILVLGCITAAALCSYGQDGVVQDVKQGAKKAGQKIKQGAETVAEKTKNTAETVGRKTEETAENIGNKTKETVAGTGEKTQTSKTTHLKSTKGSNKAEAGEQQSASPAPTAR